MAWLSGWRYRKEITLNNTGGALTDFQLSFTVNRSSGSDSGFTVYVGSNCEADYDDIRFTTNDGTTLLDLWIESYDANTATIVVELDSIAGSGDTTIFLYYGKADATAVSSIGDTMVAGDDFPGSSLNTDIWDVTGSTPGVSGGIVTLNTAGQKIATKTTAGQNYRMRARIRADCLGGSSSNQRQYGWGNPSTPKLASFAVDGDYLGNYEYLNYESGWAYGSIGNTWSGGYAIWEIIRNGSTNVLEKVNGVTQRTEATQILSGNHPVFLRVVGLNNTTILCDWIYIAKYSATEPTVSAWGSEEDFYAPKAFTGKYSIFQSKEFEAIYSLLCTSKEFVGVYDIIITAVPKEFTGKYSIWAGKPFEALYSIFQSKEFTGLYGISAGVGFTGKYSILAGKPFTGVYSIFQGKTFEALYSILAGKSFTAKYRIDEFIHFDDRVQIDFDAGSSEIQIGETLTGDDTGATAEVLAVVVTAGDWGAGTAEGYVIATGTIGVFADDEDLNGSVSGDGVAVVDGDPARLTPKTFSYTVEKDITNGFWTATILLDGVYTAAEVANYKDTLIEMPDHLGAMHTVFCGVIPDFGVVQNVAEKTTTVHAYSHDWYLTRQFVPEGDRGTATWIPSGVSGYMSFLEPSVVVTALLGGVALWNETTGVKPLYINPVVAWGSSSIPVRGWAWKPNQTRRDAIMEICTYLGWIYDTVYDGNNQGGRFCALADIDTYMGVPAPVTFTRPGDPFNITVSSETRGREKANRVRVRANRNTRKIPFDGGMVEFIPGHTVVDGGTGAEATIISCTKLTGTWGVDAAGYLIISYDRTGRYVNDNTIVDELGAAFGWAVVNGYDEPFELHDVYNYAYPETAPVRPREYFEDLDEAFDSTPLIEARALEIFNFRSLDATLYTATVHDRPDLMPWQKIKFVGFTGIPEVWMRIIHIRKQYTSGKNCIVTLSLNNATYIEAQQKMNRSQVDSDAKAVEIMVKEMLEKYLQINDVEALKVEGDYVTAEMTDAGLIISSKGTQ